MNSASLLLILLWPFLLAHSLHIKQLTAPIGRPFSVSTAEWHAIDAEMLPHWCRFNASARLIYGIPQLDDLGLHLISIHDTHIEVEVLEEDEDICGEDSSTTWLEVMDTRRLVDLPIQEQFKSVKTILGFLQKDVDVKLTDVRVFPRSYLGRYRTVRETIHELDDQDDDDDEGEVKNSRLDDRIVFVMNISCGELTEQASEIINAVAENGMDFQVVEGELKEDRVPITTSTTSTQSTTTQQNTRTTRRVHNNRPIVLNPMKTFTCSRGLLCRLPIDENTFMDPEDGSTTHLALSVHPIGNHSNFLTIVQRKNLLEGVPLENGSNAFSFRLEARDRQNAVNSAPFQVLVKPLPEGKPNHRYSMLLDIPFERFQSQPELLREFVYKLSAALHHPHHQFGMGQKEMDEIQIEDLVDNGGGQTMLKWWNASLSWAHCDEARINGTRDRMMHFGTERVKNEFVKRMGAGLHVRRVTLELLGKCLTRHLLDTAQIRVYTTTQKSTDLGQREKMGLWSNQLLIPLILLATILLLITVLTLLCCAHQRRGKKGKRNEFTTKGRPVVFPDEVPHRDESSSADGSLATVTTPMLVEREQPPLDPTKMTMHENPLYRPPPQVQAQLVRKSVPTNEMSPPMGSSPSMGRGGQFAHQSPPPLASTFSPPGAVVLKPIDASPTPLRTNPFLRDHPNQQSVRVHATPVGQRLPPPYVAH